jgi:uncharacterized membrane protein
VFESIFEFLFKYRPILFSEGTFRFAAPAWLWIALIGLILAVVALGSYRTARGKASSRDRWLLGTIRLGILGLALFCLLRPTLVLSRVVPQRNFVGVLLDDSRSMALDDGSGGQRAELVTAQFGSQGENVLAALSDRFAIRLFRFSDVAQRIDSVAELGFGGTETDLASAIDLARNELAGVPVSGLVVVTDGSDNSGAPIEDVLLPLKAENVPVFTVGVGEEVIPSDIQVSRVETPRVVLEGSSLVVDVVVTQTGFTGTTVPLIVEDDGRVISTEEFVLGRTGEPTTVRVRFETADAGPRIFRFRVPVQNGERVSQNNVQDALIEVRDDTEKILYFEGEPRPEAKFIRRAIEDDANLQVVVLQRTAEQKYLRLDVDEPDELLGGFPATREELFRYRALVLGSVEASYFSHDQLQMLADFVNERGGGLLTLGGRRALAEGGYVGTPVEDVLPVVLTPFDGGRPPFISDLYVTPTRAGLSHPVTQLASNETDSRERWLELPPLGSFNPISELKPGATPLLTAEAGDYEQVILAFQRYGRGKAIALPVVDTWKWQMAATIPVDDMTHERFWRQLLRWLVDGAPQQVETRTPVDRVQPGGAVMLQTLVSDSAFIEVNGAAVTATITEPSGTQREVRMDWTVERDGEYATDLVTSEPGLYRVDVRAERGAEAIGGDITYVQAVESQAEYFDAGMKASLLERVAEETGGRFYTAETVSSLPEDIQYTGGGVTLIEEEDLWDMPVLFLLLLTLVGLEWAYRRIRELA